MTEFSHVCTNYDMCLESLCSLASTTETEKILGEALSLLIPSLLKLKKENFNDLQARFEAQVGARKATEPTICYKVPVGGSYGRSFISFLLRGP